MSDMFVSQSCVEEVDGGVDQLSSAGVHGGHLQFRVRECHPSLYHAQRASTLRPGRRRCSFNRRQIQTNVGAPEQSMIMCYIFYPPSMQYIHHVATEDVSGYWLRFDRVILPAKARGSVFTGIGLCVCLCVYLSVTTITKKIVDGFVPNFMGRFLGGKGRPSSCFVTIGRGVWK